MMKTTVQILLSGMFVIFTGCVTLYKPNVIHSPMIREKGELNTSASAGIVGSGLFNLQAAYAISNHAGVIFDGMYHTRYFTSADSSVEKLNIFFVEAGSGYFTPTGNKKNGLFQCYGGFGYGFTSDKIEYANQPDPEVNSKYFNVFVQPGFAYTHKYFEIAFDLRANYVHMFDIHAYLYDQFEWWNTDSKFYSDTTLSFMNLEPAVTFGAGGEKLKGIVQLGITIPAINSHTYFDVNTSSLMMVPLFKFSVGIKYTFGRSKPTG
jgi:hypothetical protein